jgi:hypothetical protein
VPPAGVDDFRRYEERVLPVLAEHGGRLVRRLRSGDGGTEVHVVEFPSVAALAAHRGDLRRVTHAPLLARPRAAVEQLDLADAPINGV